MKEIVFATDFSKCSDKAASEAKKIAQGLNVPLKVVHVFDVHLRSPGPYHAMPGVSQSFMQEYIDEARENGKKALESLSQKMEAQEAIFLEGDPAKKIVEFVDEQGVDFLILGSHGYGMLDRMLLGSVTNYIAKHANCSVSIIKSEKE